MEEGHQVKAITADCEKQVLDFHSSGSSDWCIAWGIDCRNCTQRHQGN